jgi:hypothetical protein
MESFGAEEKAQDLRTARQQIALRREMLNDYRLIKAQTLEALHKSRVLLARSKPQNFVDIANGQDR